MHELHATSNSGGGGNSVALEKLSRKLSRRPFEPVCSASLTEDRHVAADFNETKCWPDIVESTPMVLANLQKAHVASVMSVHVLAPR